jgi:glutathione synthase/RimK-type ligase-like ATP-grasp enzyme
MSVLLATCSSWPDGEPGAPALDAALAARGVDARWARWDDPSVDWDGADLVVVRSTWDYAVRYDEFLRWARGLDQARLLNGADVFDWNHDKRYLAELDGLPVVPTRLAATSGEFTAAIAEFGRTVVKPRVSAGGAGLIVVDDPADDRLGTTIRSHPSYPPVGGPWIAQPLVESIRESGESSVFVIGGRVCSQVDKWPAGEEVRVHEEFGGRSHPVPPGDETSALALRAWVALAERFGRPLDYARVDMLRYGGRWVVSELELIEPGLYLDVLPGNAEPFADAVRDRL